MIERLCLIGVGLIGGSLALALKAADACHYVVGVGRNPDNLDDALRLGIIDAASHDAVAAVKDADLVVLAVPVGMTESVCRSIAPALDPNAILTDVGSVKGSVIEQVTKAFGAVPPRFVPGHPIAGTEKSGARHAFASLFAERNVILTPLMHTDPDAVETVQRLWLACGAVVETMDYAKHDRILAATSHLPHMLAFGLVDSLARLQDSDEIFRFAAGGFRDFTRIASSDPTMWRDICLHNRDALLQALTRYEDDLARLHDAIERGDAEVLSEIFTRAKSARDQLVVDL